MRGSIEEGILKSIDITGGGRIQERSKGEKEGVQSITERWYRVRQSNWRERVAFRHEGMWSGSMNEGSGEDEERTIRVLRE